jgi:putative DNA primase/helicase
MMATGKLNANAPERTGHGGDRQAAKDSQTMYTTEAKEKQAPWLDPLQLVNDALNLTAGKNGNGPEGASWADMALQIGPIEWAWNGWMPQGFVIILAAGPGEGKSAAALRLAGCYLRGDPWPDGQPFTGQIGDVLWCEAEAAQALNLERARAWGYPLDHILTPHRDPLADVSFDDPEDQKAIAAVASRESVRFVVFDSLSGGNRKDENSSEILETVKWIAELARDTGKPMLLLHHLRKRGLADNAGQVNLERLRGSSSIVQMSRVVWAIDAPDANDEATKRLAVIKSNLARFPDPVGMSVGECGVTFVAAPRTPKVETQLDRAVDLLKALLDQGPRSSDGLEEEAKGAGLSWDTMKRAKDKLGVVARRDGKTRRWSWALSYPAED